MSDARAYERPVDLVLIAAVVSLLTLGTVEIFSASAVEGLRRYEDSFRFLKMLLLFLVLGMGALYAGARIHYHTYKRFAYPLLGGAILMLLAVLVLGREINGARRWFMLGPLSFQPAEVAKFALIVYLAYSLSKKADKVRFFAIGFIPHLGVCALIVLLLMRQPDFGSSLLLMMTTFTMMFVAGANFSYMILAVLAVAPIAYMMVVGTWRLQRLMAYLNPEAYRDTTAYQIIQSRIAIGSGGPTGLGLGEGRQTLGYMPEGYNDFIMACVGEELGFVGFSMIILLFCVFLWRGFKAALAATDSFGAYLALGITLVLGFQALINIAVVLGVIPAKGITLPFVSYGGSSLTICMFLVGVLINIGRRQEPPPMRSQSPRECAKRRRERAVIV
jgi:cell division protein FtsW